MLAVLRKSLTLCCILILAACAQATQIQNKPASPNSPTPDEALQADAAEYARQMGVSQEEAERRLSMQLSFGELNALLQAEQAETFAGLWIQHQPEYKLIVAFTRDGEQTLQPYLTGQLIAGRIELRRFPYSLAELQAAQQAASEITQSLGIPTSSSIDVPENVVTLYTGNPQLFQQELEAAGKELPEPVRVVALDPDRLTDILRGELVTYPGLDGKTIYFPKQPPTAMYLEALTIGTLILDPQGCLRLESENGPLILWRYGFELKIDGEKIEVLDEDDHVVARVGEEVKMGGGGVPPTNIPGVPIPACPGGYWALGEIYPADQ